VLCACLQQLTSGLPVIVHNRRKAKPKANQDGPDTCLVMSSPRPQIQEGFADSAGKRLSEKMASTQIHC
jgi:hypothetical protein